MKANEEELNSIIVELRANYASLQERFTLAESDKLVRLVEEMLFPLP